MRLDDVRHNYDRLAPVYDLADRCLVEPFAGMSRLRRETVDALDLNPGDRVLDVGCGTGLNLGLLVQAVGEQGQIVALDYSPGMLERARRRVERNGWRNVRLVQGDAAVLAGIEGPFDGVMSTWALGIVHDLPAALRRMCEVLAPGGRLAILDLHRTRSSSAARRYLVDPLVHGVLRWSGVDTPEDLDDRRLHERWAAGWAYLRETLIDVTVTPNVRGKGFALTGRRAP